MVLTKAIYRYYITDDSDWFIPIIFPATSLSEHSCPSWGQSQKVPDLKTLDSCRLFDPESPDPGVLLDRGGLMIIPGLSDCHTEVFTGENDDVSDKSDLTGENDDVSDKE